MTDDRDAPPAEQDTMTVSRSPARQDILHAIEEMPGLSIQEIAEAVVLSRSTVRYHVRRLVRDQRVVVHRQGNHCLHFATAMPRMRRRAIALLRIRSLRSIAETLLPGDPVEEGGRDHDAAGGLILVTDLADGTDIDLRSVYRGLKALERAGLIEMERAAKRRGAYKLSPHPEFRIAWVLHCKGAGRAPRPLRRTPGWLVGFELLLGKFVLNGWDS